MSWHTKQEAPYTQWDIMFAAELTGLVVTGLQGCSYQTTRCALKAAHNACICDLETDNLKVGGQQKLFQHGVTCRKDALPEFPGGMT